MIYFLKTYGVYPICASFPISSCELQALLLVGQLPSSHFGKGGSCRSPGPGGGFNVLSRSQVTETPSGLLEMGLLRAMCCFLPPLSYLDDKFILSVSGPAPSGPSSVSPAHQACRLRVCPSLSGWLEHSGQQNELRSQEPWLQFSAPSFWLFPVSIT